MGGVIRANIILCTKYYVIASVAWQSPGREPYYKTHARYFCTCVEKKAHTSKRVSIAAPDNAISKEQCATHLPEGKPCCLWQ